MIDWSKLRHCYGPATDVPDLLAQAAVAPPPRANTDDEPWFTLWSSLCHQHDVYTGSYAAVPELVAIAIARRLEMQAAAELLLLAGCIELERHRPGSPPLPPFLQDAYAEALQAGAALATESLRHDADDHIRLCFTIGRHCFEGRFDEVRRLLDEDEDPE
jgi:hypothetical protein